MEDGKPVIYGLEFQARALAAQVAESETIRFLVGTQSLKLENNQIHIVELHEDSGTLSTQVYQHAAGEVWSLAASPGDSSKIITCFNTLSENGCQVKAALWNLPNLDSISTLNPKDETDKLPQLEKVCSLEAKEQVQDVRTVAFHPTDGQRAVSVLDSQCMLWDLGQNDARVTTTVSLEGKGHPRFTTGKWNPHHNYSQFATAHDSHVRSWDLRSPQTPAWSIESAHCQLVRDVDFNPNKQYYLATCGDDGCSKFWDSRDPSEPIAVRSDHSHWVWQIRFNHFHDQLILTSSSDSRVILTSMASISSEPYSNSGADEVAEAESEQRRKLEDGVLATYEEHEDSVYCVEWSCADPWTFASLSYDGRLVINQVPREDKYKILL
ncbi:Probable histone-binding protein Caf1 [Gryllus bimaculatus]|nr:Probable histone-binding protein Caf1 [Gryllus bimaculatus]